MNLWLRLAALWNLEKFLRPCSPGVYPLANCGLHLQGDPHELIALLESGLQGELPKSVRANILGQPSVQIRQGIIIEFSDWARDTRLAPIDKSQLWR